MALTSLNAPLMCEILAVIRSYGEREAYDTDWITARIREKGFWDGKTARSPERTVNSYLSQSPDVFEYVGGNRYRLRVEHFQPAAPLEQIDSSEPDEAQRTVQEVARIIRQTVLIEKLKRLHNDQCQICGVAIQLGDRSYSEGHHIRPLARKGPDIAENILILCPNHHVLCDYGGIRINRTDLRMDSQHKVGDEYIRWHNTHLFRS